MGWIWKRWAATTVCWLAWWGAEERDGAGYTVKLLVNLLWFGQAVATGEALLLARRAGIDLDGAPPDAGGWRGIHCLRPGRPRRAARRALPHVLRAGPVL